MPKKTKTTNRFKVLKALRDKQLKARRKEASLSAAEIREAIEMDENNGQLGVILRGEAKAGRIEGHPYLVSNGDGEGGREVTYYNLTAAGIAALKNGTIDSEARARHLAQLGRTPVL